jgi:XTP/dITP diphosphohydrolase
MTDFSFVTSNDHKVATATSVCGQFGITFDRQNLDLVEIQSDKGEDIARYKVVQAYEKYQRPVAITDDSWIIPALRGFPGPYMKYINQWFEPSDFLRLTSTLKDRRMIMRHVIAYKDEKTEKIFSVDIEGTLLKEARGSHIIPHFSIISFDGGRHSVAEQEEATGGTVIADLPNAWHQFCEWLKPTLD